MDFPTNWNGEDLASVDLVIAGHQDPGHHRVPEQEEAEFHNQGFGSGFGLDLDSIKSVDPDTYLFEIRIRIQEGKNDQQK
jgi:hypothetical protein